MARPKSLEPKYRHHKSSGQAYVVIDGKDVWLGEFDSRASRDKYHAVISEWIARGRQGAPPSAAPAATATVTMVIAAYLRHARSYFARAEDGGAPPMIDHLRGIARVMVPLYGATPAAEFGPLKLKAVRQAMLQPRRQTDKATGATIERPGWSRNYVNDQIARIKAMMKWAAGNEMLPAATYQALLAVAGLRRGKTEARETAPVVPAPEALIEPVRARVSSQVQAMIDLQLLTGARPGEICVMRTGDIDRNGAVWIYRPASHKNAHRGHAREIFMGPKAQAILTPLLKFDPMAYVFSPAEAERARAERRRAGRKTRVQPSQIKRAERARRRRRRRPPTDRYTVSSYRAAIGGACRLAFPPPEPLARLRGESAAAWRARLTPEQAAELQAWRRDHSWHPHQLRHNAATRLRREYGLEAAQVILGHKTLAVTEIYAEKNVARAREVMGAVG